MSHQGNHFYFLASAQVAPPLRQKNIQDACQLIFLHLFLNVGGIFLSIFFFAFYLHVIYNKQDLEEQKEKKMLLDEFEYPFRNDKTKPRAFSFLSFCLVVFCSRFGYTES